MALQAVREAVGIPVLANGNILSRADADACMAYTGTQGVLSAGLFLYQTAYSAASTIHRQ
jgi:tRNA-dihydrouridine synthase 1